ncbi:MAG: hypothetical protein OCC49_05115 [Fibrobacterales bacterium]
MKILMIVSTSLLLCLMACSSQFTITDFSGRTITLDKVNIGKSNELFGLLGESEITIPLEDILTLKIDATYKRVHNSRVLYRATVTFMEGKKPAISSDSTIVDHSLYIDIGHKVKGMTEVGSVTLPLKSVKGITQVIEKEKAPEPEQTPTEKESQTESIPADAGVTNETPGEEPPLQQP